MHSINVDSLAGKSIIIAMKRNFFLTPIYALFDRSFYREAVQTWREKQIFLFLTYLVSFYVLGIMLSLLRLNNQSAFIFGKFDDNHPIVKLLSASPRQWTLDNQGISLFAEDGTPIEKWHFENWVYIDTTQAADFTPPEESAVVMSKSLLWFSGGRDARAVRFREWREKAGQDIKLSVYRNTEGVFDHFEMVGQDGKTRFITKADVRAGFRFTKIVIVSLVFLFSWLFLFLYKILAVAVLSLVGFILNAVLKRGLDFRKIFVVCLLIQSPVILVHIFQMGFPFLIQRGALISWSVSLVYLGIVFFRFLPATENESAHSS